MARWTGDEGTGDETTSADQTLQDNQSVNDQNRSVDDNPTWSDTQTEPAPEPEYVEPRRHGGAIDDSGYIAPPEPDPPVEEAPAPRRHGGAVDDSGYIPPPAPPPEPEYAPPPRKHGGAIYDDGTDEAPPPPPMPDDLAQMRDLQQQEASYNGSGFDGGTYNDQLPPPTVDQQLGGGGDYSATPPPPPVFSDTLPPPLPTFSDTQPQASGGQSWSDTDPVPPPPPDTTSPDWMAQHYADPVTQAEKNNYVQGTEFGKAVPILQKGMQDVTDQYQQGIDYGANTLGGRNDPYFPTAANAFAGIGEGIRDLNPFSTPQATTEQQRVAAAYAAYLADHPGDHEGARKYADQQLGIPERFAKDVLLSPWTAISGFGNAAGGDAGQLATTAADTAFTMQDPVGAVAGHLVGQAAGAAARRLPDFIYGAGKRVGNALDEAIQPPPILEPVRVAEMADGRTGQLRNGPPSILSERSTMRGGTPRTPPASELPPPVDLAGGGEATYVPGKTPVNSEPEYFTEGPPVTPAPVEAQALPPEVTTHQRQNVQSLQDIYDSLPPEQQAVMGNPALKPQVPYVEPAPGVRQTFDTAAGNARVVPPDAPAVNPQTGELPITQQEIADAMQQRKQMQSVNLDNTGDAPSPRNRKSIGEQIPIWKNLGPRQKASLIGFGAGLTGVSLAAKAATDTSAFGSDQARKLAGAVYGVQPTNTDPLNTVRDYPVRSFVPFLNRYAVNDELKKQDLAPLGIANPDGSINKGAVDAAHQMNLLALDASNDKSPSQASSLARLQALDKQYPNLAAGVRVDSYGNGQTARGIIDYLTKRMLPPPPPAGFIGPVLPSVPAPAVAANADLKPFQISGQWAGSRHRDDTNKKDDIFYGKNKDELFWKSDGKPVNPPSAAPSIPVAAVPEVPARPTVLPSPAYIASDKARLAQADRDGQAAIAAGAYPTPGPAAPDNSDLKPFKANQYAGERFNPAIKKPEGIYYGATANDLYWKSGGRVDGAPSAAGTGPQDTATDTSDLKPFVKDGFAGTRYNEETGQYDTLFYGANEHELHVRPPKGSGGAATGGGNYSDLKPFVKNGFAGTRWNPEHGQQESMYYGNTPNELHWAQPKGSGGGSAASGGGKSSGGGSGLVAFVPGGYAGRRMKDGTLHDIYYGDTADKLYWDPPKFSGGGSGGGKSTGGSSGGGSSAPKYPFSPGAFAGYRWNEKLGGVDSLYWGKDNQTTHWGSEGNKPDSSGGTASASTQRSSLYAFQPGGLAMTGINPTTNQVERRYYGATADDPLEWESEAKPKSTAGSQAGSVAATSGGSIPTIYDPPKAGGSQYRQIGGTWFGWDGHSWVDSKGTPAQGAPSGNVTATSPDGSGPPTGGTGVYPGRSGGGRTFTPKAPNGRLGYTPRYTGGYTNGGLPHHQGRPNQAGRSMGNYPAMYAPINGSSSSGFYPSSGGYWSNIAPADRNALSAYFAGVGSMQGAEEIANRYGMSLDMAHQLFTQTPRWRSLPTAPERERY